MNRTERIYRIQQLLKARRAVPREVFLDELEVSPATFKRDLEHMRDFLYAPIIYDRELKGYRLSEEEQTGPVYELPGLWFNAAEMNALITMHELLVNLEPGALRMKVVPLIDRIDDLLGNDAAQSEEVRRRVKILGMAARPVTPKHFESIVSALISRKRLGITHFHRGREETLSREVSPQRVVHYRDNWYLDAWCHQRNDLRTFAMDTIQHVTALDKAAQDIPEHRLDAALGAGYGIFAGPATEVAKLRFSPKRARWVANEQWHPEQRGETREDGSFILEVPYSDDRELVMDIMKYGPDVEVLEPASLRERVLELHQEAAKRYTLAGPRRPTPRSGRSLTDTHSGRRLGS